MAKYIIDIPDDGQCQYRYDEDTKELKFPHLRLDPNMGLDIAISISGVTPYTEPDRKAIEDEVWEFAHELSCMKYKEIRDCFGIGYHSEIDVVSFLAHSKAKAKYEAWKKWKDEIHVGDEVKYHGDNCVVVYVGADEVYHVSDKHWSRCVVQGRQFLTKTGRHFDEVEKLLERMKAE